MEHDGYQFHQFKTTFCEFKSINDILCLIFSRGYFNSPLISYDIVKNQVVNKINKVNVISDIRHHLDTQLKKDLILLTFVNENEIEVSDFKNWQVLMKISHVNGGICLFSSCFYNDNNNIYILTSHNIVDYPFENECIKVFDMKKNKVKEITNSNEKTFYIDSHYDSKFDKNFIVTCNQDHINFYDFQNNSLFKQYKNDATYEDFNDFVVDDRGSNKKLLGSCYSGIKIWDFYTGELLKKTISNLMQIYGLCLFGQNYLLAGSEYNIVFIDLTNEKIISKIKINRINEIASIKEIDIKNGKFFICGGRWSDIILLENKEFEFNIKTTIENSYAK